MKGNDKGWKEGRARGWIKKRRMKHKKTMDKKKSEGGGEVNTLKEKKEGRRKV